MDRVAALLDNPRQGFSPYVAHEKIAQCLGMILIRLYISETLHRHELAVIGHGLVQHLRLTAWLVTTKLATKRVVARHIVAYALSVSTTRLNQ